MIYNVKVVPIWTLKPQDIFSWSITMRPLCRMLGFDSDTCLYKYVYLSDPDKIRYSRIDRTICLTKN